MPILRPGQAVGRYTVQSLIKENLYVQTYRVEDVDQNPFFLKIFIDKLLPAKLFDSETGNILEIELCRTLKHRNILSFIESGKIECVEGTAQYYIANYLSGEMLSDKIRREGKLQQDAAIAIYREILCGLQHMHSKGLCHNDITPRNIMLSQKTDGIPEIIDLGHISRPCRGKTTFDTSDLDCFYQANETFGGMYDEQSDIFAATAVLYTMLSGHEPWKTDIDPTLRLTRRAILLKEFRKNNELDWSGMSIDDRTKAIIQKGLSISYQERYRNVQAIINDLDSDKVPQAPDMKKNEPEDRGSGRGQNNGKKDDIGLHDDFEIKRGGGNGFADIAGMHELKDFLTKRVLFAIKNKAKMESYRINPINAMLLWGPPGCGKSFVAEKFAEESGYNYMWIKSSDLASSYVHGSQQRIAHLFDQAAKNAPIVICFDEFDALVPDRSSYAAKDMSAEVNEFLSQLNNCSQRGIFVIGTTNRPDKIDSAVMRTGRVDKQVYVPMPDTEARCEMFKIHLKGRPLSDQINYERLATLTDGFIASDIAYVVNDAALMAAYTDQPITMQLIETSIGNTHPSLRKDMLEEYDRIKKQMEGAERRANAGRHVVSGFTPPQS